MKQLLLVILGLFAIVMVKAQVSAPEPHLPLLKSYISIIENNITESRISTLQKIVELGFGGQLHLSNKL